MKELKRTLSFIGTAGDDVAELVIDRKSSFDLTSLFKDIFDKYHDKMAYYKASSEKKEYTGLFKKYRAEFKDNYQINEDVSLFSFKIDELLSATMYAWDSLDFRDFLSTHMIEPQEFANETLLHRLNDFPEVYSRILMHYSSKYFMVESVDKHFRPQEIEALMPPNCGPYKSSDVVSDFKKLNPFYGQDASKRLTTKPYDIKSMDNVLEALSRSYPERKILCVHDLALPKLNNIHICNHYNMPTDNLKLVEK